MNRRDFTWNDSEPGGLEDNARWIFGPAGVRSRIIRADVWQGQHLHFYPVIRVGAARLCNTRQEKRTSIKSKSRRCVLRFFLELQVLTLRILTWGRPSGEKRLPFISTCFSHCILAPESPWTLHRNWASLPTTAVAFSGRPACREGLRGGSSASRISENFMKHLCFYVRTFTEIGRYLEGHLLSSILNLGKCFLLDGEII